MLTKLAVLWITRQLRKDKGLWYAYQSSIAMAILDNYNKFFPLKTDPVGSPTLHEFCNICANSFLNLWTNSRTEPHNISIPRNAI